MEVSFFAFEGGEVFQLFARVPGQAEGKQLLLESSETLMLGGVWVVSRHQNCPK